MALLPACKKAPLAESMNLDRTRAILKEGAELSLVAEVLPEASSRSLQWTSSNPEVATVDDSGRVKALSKGETTITAATRDGSGLEATCAVRVFIAGNPVALDFGLNVLWADRNLGATCPEDVGEYFAWGELEPKYVYSWDTYRFGNSGETMTKYTENTRLDPEDDIAHVLLGGKWRMPTEAEVAALYAAYYPLVNEDATINGVSGHMLRGKNEYEGKSLFFPFGGYISKEKYIDKGFRCCLWVANKSGDPGKGIIRMLMPVNQGNLGVGNWSLNYGASIRPVCDK